MDCARNVESNRGMYIYRVKTDSESDKHMYVYRVKTELEDGTICYRYGFDTLKAAQWEVKQLLDNPDNAGMKASIEKQEVSNWMPADA